MASLARALRRPYVRLRDGLGELVFERRFGTRTSEEIDLQTLGIDAEGRVRHQPVGWLMIRRILSPRDVSPNDVFLDIGSGMGRAVLIAATYPFRRVIGVELSETLSAIAQDNVDRCRERLRCQDISLIVADAVGYEIPDEVTVVFMNNPLLGSLFADVLRNILDSYDRRPRDLRIIYQNPIEEPMLLATGRIRLVKRVSGLRPGRQWSRSNSIRLYAVQPR
jgi:SAM-dependent methyltransferase